MKEMLILLEQRPEHERRDGVSCPFHKLELHEIGKLPATRTLGSSSCRTS